MSKTVYLVEQGSDGVMESLGLRNIEVPKTIDFRRFTTSLIEENVSLAFISEGVYRRYKEWIDLYHDSLEISFVVLASMNEKEGLGMKRLNQSIEEAIGMKIGGK